MFHKAGSVVRFRLFVFIFGNMKSIVLATSLIAIIRLTAAQPAYFEPVSFSNVTITDPFWKARIGIVSSSTIPACVEQTEIKTPRIQNFEVAAKLKPGKFEGIFYDDSDVYKAIEAIAYSLRNNPNPELEARTDSWIDKIAAAQLPDGYINTYYTLNGLDKRWTDMSMHEDYNGGHLIEAAIAYYQTTGKRKLLDVAIRFADHFDSLFGPGKRPWVTGHQELELALVKLYKITGEQKYLRLADWLLDQRGRKLAVGYTWSQWRDTAYAQDVVPVKQQREITGHAVRAMYLYTGAADVAAQTGDQDYINAMKAVWEDVVYRNMYITGGIGSSGRNEGFSQDYDLPNLQAYCETCASVGMVFWNLRMNKLTGEAKYADVLERSLFNGAQSGLSLSGDRFFYGNPLASTGTHYRRAWFGTACCPANIARLTASVGDYIYGVSQQGIWVNQYIGSKTSLSIGRQNVDVEMVSDYMWNGKVTIAINPSKPALFALYLRMPGWSVGQPVPGDLYQTVRSTEKKPIIRLNGAEPPLVMDKGYVVLSRKWRKGDRIEIQFPMDVMELKANEQVKYNRNRIALQRGPLVYCVEGADNGGNAFHFIVPENTVYTSVQDSNTLGGIVKIQFTVPALDAASETKVETVEKTITAIPYFTWCNRGQNPMQVWLPRKFEIIRVNPEN
ncbi:MAG: glycoside hydrolase family 127 protein [Cyclobacteriaceae bacterium]|nr:glycoside hydrolase family 127 protein [Cyclobacteriaceae bacterium]